MRKGIDYIGVSVGALFTNKRGEIFLSKRSKHARNQKGCWETPGGAVDFGEKREDAIKREMKEEFGIDIEIIKELQTIDELLLKEKQHWVATIYTARIRGNRKPKILEPQKCDAIGWFSLDKLPSPLSVVTKIGIKVYEEKCRTEMVDVVGEDATILYKTSKTKAHELGLLHKTVIAEVIDRKGRWVLVKQASDRQDAGQYVSPVGGHVRSGESEVDALYREAKEELGLKNFQYKFIGKAVFNRRILGRQENHYFILYEIYSDERPKLNQESVGYRSFTKYQIKRQLKNNPKKFGDAFYFIVKTFYPDLM